MCFRISYFSFHLVCLRFSLVFISCSIISRFIMIRNFICYFLAICYWYFLSHNYRERHTRRSRTVEPTAVRCVTGGTCVLVTASRQSPLYEHVRDSHRYFYPDMAASQPLQCPSPIYHYDDPNNTISAMLIADNITATPMRLATE